MGWMVGWIRGFFFSSRRRHTRYWRDWSSDVCSSDLSDEVGASLLEEIADLGQQLDLGRRLGRSGGGRPLPAPQRVYQIGRGPCRERVYVSVVVVSFKKKKQTTAALIQHFPTYYISTL